MVALGAISVCAQRRVTPVTQSTNRVVMPKKGEKLKEFVRLDSAARDSLRRDSIEKIYPRYPLLTDVTIGVNFWEPLMRLFGQKHGGVGFSATLNMWNRLLPKLEVGFGTANSTPEGMNFTYKSKLALYAKIGADYNFLFKKSPDYMLFAGAHVGFSSFKYDIVDITPPNNYWDEKEKFSILGEKSSAVWGEINIGLRVKIYKGFSLGWTGRYVKRFSIKNNEHSQPWYVPGLGTKAAGLSASFSVYYTIPLSKNKWPKPSEQKDAAFVGIDNVGGAKSETPPPADSEAK